MKRMIFGAIFAALAAVPGLAPAGVVPVEQDGTPPASAFLDASTGLYWSQPQVIGQVSVADATSLLAGASFEGLSGWRLPTAAEFHSLYATQGSGADGRMVSDPFTFAAPSTGYLWYWTADPDPNNASLQMAWSPTSDRTNSYFSTLQGNNGPYLWAVASIPEPSDALLLITGLAMLMPWIPKARASAAVRG